MNFFGSVRVVIINSTVVNKSDNISIMSAFSKSSKRMLKSVRAPTPPPPPHEVMAVRVSPVTSDSEKNMTVMDILRDVTKGTKTIEYASGMLMLKPIVKVRGTTGLRTMVMHFLGRMNKVDPEMTEAIRTSIHESKPIRMAQPIVVLIRANPTLLEHWTGICSVPFARADKESRDGHTDAHYPDFEATIKFLFPAIFRIAEDLSFDDILASISRTSPSAMSSAMTCKGKKLDGVPCHYNQKHNGFCLRHQKQAVACA